MLHILEDSTVNAISENKGTLYSFKRSCHLQAMICLLVLIYIKSSQLRYMYLFLFSILLQTKLLSMVVIFFGPMLKELLLCKQSCIGYFNLTFCIIKKELNNSLFYRVFFHMFVDIC